MLIIKQLPDDWYRVKHLFKNFSDVDYDTFDSALNLCRLRCNKLLIDDNIKIVKIPFANMLIVW